LGNLLLETVASREPTPKNLLLEALASGELTPRNGGLLGTYSWKLWPLYLLLLEYLAHHPHCEIFREQKNWSRRPLKRHHRRLPRRHLRFACFIRDALYLSSAHSQGRLLASPESPGKFHAVQLGEPWSPSAKARNLVEGGTQG
jgi:hypothetical protein